MIESKISSEIITRKKTNGLTVVSICGAADLGKSFLSKRISNILIENNLTTNHLTMDSFLLNRETRLKKGLSGYNIEAYNKEKALKNLIALKNGKSINLKKYNHKQGKALGSSIMNFSDILIFDGLHTMHSSFKPHIDISIFIHTNDTFLKQIRLEADLLKRNYTPTFSETISEKEFNLYKDNIEPYKEKADYLLYLEKKWNYQLELTHYNNM